MRRVSVDSKHTLASLLWFFFCFRTKRIENCTFEKCSKFEMNHPQKYLKNISKRFWINPLSLNDFVDKILVCVKLFVLENLVRKRFFWKWIIFFKSSSWKCITKRLQQRRLCWAGQSSNWSASFWFLVHISMDPKKLDHFTTQKIIFYLQNCLTFKIH